MTLQLSRASKSFGADVLFENLSFEIKKGEYVKIKPNYIKVMSS